MGQGNKLAIPPFQVFFPFSISKICINLGKSPPTIMQHFIIDLDSLLSHPQLICYKHKEYTLWISDYYLEENVLSFDSRIPRNSLRHFMEAALEQEFITSIPINKDIQPIYTSFLSINTYIKDIDFYRVLMDQYNKLEQLKNGDEIWIVSTDENYSKKIPPKKALKELRNKGATYNEDLARISINLSDEHWIGKYLFFILFTGLLLAAVFSKQLMAYCRGNLYIGSILGIAVLPAVWLLFKLRSKRRFLYGLLEVVIGLVAFGQVLYFTDAKTFSNFDYLKIISGIYIVIRGLANIEEGMEKSKNRYFLEKWRKIF